MDLNNVRIQYRIKQDTPFGEFNDALYFTQNEWDIITPSEVDDLVAQRVQNYIDIVSSPPPPPEKPTQEQLQEQLAFLETEVAKTKSDILAIDPGVIFADPIDPGSVKGG